MVEDIHIHSREPGLRHVAVIGGANTDIAGISDAALVARDSNPGRVRVSPGGVARNIADNLARLGVSVHLITAFGADHNARELERGCREARIDIAGSLTVPTMPGAVYLSIMDEHGDMALALNDMRLLDRLSPAALSTRVHILRSAELIVVDTNIPAESLSWLAQNTELPIVLDAVSIAKAPRALAVLPRLEVLKASAAEAGVLLGRDVRNRDHALDAAREFVSLGVKRTFVTSGAFGTAWAEESGSGHLAAAKVPVVRNTTGAGDAFTAGVTYATLEAWPTTEAAAFGSACAALALESEDTVSQEMSLERARGRMKAMLA